jgi:hypothetical protein
VAAATIDDEDLRVFESKLNTLKLDYERYFLGTRPREPIVARQEIQRFVTLWANTPIQNTALRFKFSSINARYQSMKRQWDNILRQMEAGTYKRDIFRANLRGGGMSASVKKPQDEASGVVSAKAGAALFDAYRDAAEACGQKLKGLTPKKLQSVVDKQTKTLRDKMGCKDVSFRVVVQDGKVKLKAAPLKD